MNGVADEQGVSFGLVLFGLRVDEIGEADAHLEDHAGLGDRMRLGRDQIVGLAELDADEEAEVGGELVDELGPLGGALLLDLLVQVAELDGVAQSVDERLLEL